MTNPHNENKGGEGRISKVKAGLKPEQTKSVPRMSRKLSENGAGKYVVHIGFTFAQLTELRQAVILATKAQNKIKHDKTAGAAAHELAGYRAEHLADTRKYLEEAHQVIKKATNARQNGRYLKRLTDVIDLVATNLEATDE